jgi:hypothetical protein
MTTELAVNSIFVFTEITTTFHAFHSAQLKQWPFFVRCVSAKVYTRLLSENYRQAPLLSTKAWERNALINKPWM